MKGKILIADDEQDIVSFVQNYFELEGYDVITAYDGAKTIEKIALHPDIILLDIMMPLLNGIEVCEAIRERVDCPIIFLTARIEEQDKILGFHVGGDDYILKPFSIEELGARVEAHLRRERRRKNPSNYKNFGRLSIEYNQRIVYYDQNKIEFTRKEYEVIELLSLHEGQVFSKERIYERVWGFDAEGNDSAVTEHVKRIRAKISAYTDESYIETIWGVGYKWLKYR